MSDDAPDSDFLRYLMCDLPLGYPLKSPISKLLVPNPTMAARRELLYQQDKFLDVANKFLPTHPWISYIAAIKHEAVLVIIPNYASQLVDIADVHFFTELQQKAKELQETSRAAIDEATALNCERMVLLQSEAAQIESANKSVKGALQSGFTAVEPLPNPPKEPSTGLEKLRNFVIGGVACLIVSAFVPWHYGGMAWGLAGAVVVGIVGYRAIKKDQAIAAEETATFKAYLHHENYHALCRKSVSLVLALPFETRKTALVNLPPCLTALEALFPERTMLEATYITPFVPK
jgi:hypothetical protein